MKRKFPPVPIFSLLSLLLVATVIAFGSAAGITRIRSGFTRSPVIWRQ